VDSAEDSSRTAAEHSSSTGQPWRGHFLQHQA
jgi:hypothetical protein